MGRTMKKVILMLWLLPLFSGCRFVEENVPVEAISLNQRQPLAKEKKLEATILFDLGSLEITREVNKDCLYSLELEYDKIRYTPNIQYTPAADSQQGQFDFNLHGLQRTGIRREPHTNRLRLAFADSVPLSLKITTGIGDARLSLSGIQLSQLDFDTGVGTAKISSYEPNTVICDHIRLKSGVGSLDAVGLANLNFRELEFKGGVGGANLDFSGDWKQNADIRIQVGVGGVNLNIPREIGVRVEAVKHFLSGLQLEGFNRRDDSSYSKNYDGAAIRITVRVTTGVGGLKITWI
jgi:hypothetical protein